MPLDSTCVAGLAGELNAALGGARIDKIHMPARDRVLMHLRGECGAVRLLLCAGSDARVHLTNTRPENPDAPPMLCMLLRKHLAGGRVLAVRQPGRERIVELAITSAGELGDITEKRLICEMTGRMTNLLLVDAQGIILACLKNVGHEQSPRPVLPGLRYQPPPAQDKVSLYDMADTELMALCAGLDTAETEPLSVRMGGVAPLLLRECAFRAGGNAAALARELIALRDMEPRPFMLVREGQPADFVTMEIGQYPHAQCVPYADFSTLLDDFYRERTRRQTMKALTAGLTKTAGNALKRLERKLADQRQELAAAQERDALKNRADLITANLHAIPPGADRVSVIDFFQPNLPQITLELDATRSPQQNAQALYKRYARLKNAETALAGQIEQGEADARYLESVLYSLSQAETAREAEDIRRELLENGYLRDRIKGKKRDKPAPFAPRRFDLGEGFTALCGRSNSENDQLTHRHAQKHDLWLHARNIPGAHVIVETGGREASDAVIEAAAGIAAYYSAGAAGGRVAVDYCLARHVKKPQGARPGMVNYFNFKTAAAVAKLPEG